MAQKLDAQTNMLAHSRAKVDLYSTYLKHYLGVLGNARHIEEIHIFDLLCGEGLYVNNQIGSPLAALETIRTFQGTSRYSHTIHLWLNDAGTSKITKGMKKIERVESLCSSRPYIPNLEIHYSALEYAQALEAAEQTIKSTKRSKHLLFIDPYGYKIIKPQDIQRILSYGSTEVLLFLPTSMMYRFAEKSLRESFPGSESLTAFLRELYGDNVPSAKSVYNFIENMKIQCRHYLSHTTPVYADTFTLERDHDKVYSLFFFTTRHIGLHRMLDAKWKLDSHEGRGFRLEENGRLFSGAEMLNYPDRLRRYIEQNNGRTNNELLMFGLQEGFLPKHTTEILKQWGTNIVVKLENGREAQKNAYYIDDEEKLVHISWCQTHTQGRLF